MAVLYVTVAVEGDSDVPVATRLLEHVGLELQASYVLHGKATLDQRLPRYNMAARHFHWFVLRDLNSDADCAPELRRQLLPNQSPYMGLRIAVRAVEAWLMADAERASRFFGVSQGRIAQQPDTVVDPKAELLSLARKSRLRAIREDLLPAEGTSSRVGPGYTMRIIEFTSMRWRPEIAAENSPSLRKCIDFLRQWKSATARRHRNR